MGADSLDYFERWRHPEIICEKATILAAVRDDMDIAEIEEKIAALQNLFPAEIYPIKGGRTEVSSTSLRQMIQNGQMDKGMIPEAVAAYIIENDIYGGDR